MTYARFNLIFMLCIIFCFEIGNTTPYTLFNNDNVEKSKLLKKIQSNIHFERFPTQNRYLHRGTRYING